MREDIFAFGNRSNDLEFRSASGDSELDERDTNAYTIPEVQI